MISTIQEKPYRLYFIFSIFIASTAALIWKYDQLFGYSSTDQGTLEQLLRLFVGGALLLLPQILFYAVVYWCMYFVKKPTVARLNLWHFYLLGTSLCLQFLYGVDSLILDDKYLVNADIDYLQEDSYLTSAGSIFNLVLILINIVAIVLFVYNIVVSLIRPNSVVDEQE